MKELPAETLRGLLREQPELASEMVLLVDPERLVELLAGGQLPGS